MRDLESRPRTTPTNLGESNSRVEFAVRFPPPPFFLATDYFDFVEFTHDKILYITYVCIR